MIARLRVLALMTF